MTKKELNPAYVLFCLAATGYLINYSLNVFLAHHLPDDVYGDYSLAIKLLAIFVILSLFGTNVSAARFLSNYLQLDKKLTAADYIAWNIKLVSVTFMVGLIVALVTFALMVSLHFLHIRDINHYHLAIYMLWVVPLSAIAMQLEAYVLCNNRFFRTTFFSQVLQYFLMLVFFMVVILVFGWKLDNITIVAIVFTAYLVLSLIILSTMKVEILLMIKAGLKHIRITPLASTEWMQTSSRLIANSIVFRITSVLDLLIVSIVAKSALDIGHYAAVLTIISSLWLIPQNLYGELRPLISSLLGSEQGKIKLQNKLDRVNVIVFSIILVLSALIICFSKTLLFHFGSSYLQANAALIILTIGVCCGAISRIAVILLVYAGYEKLLLIVSVSEFILLLILAVPATYFFNITGTAAATAFVMIVKPAVAVYVVRKKIGLRSIILL